MRQGRQRVCPARLAWTLDNRIRRWLQDPRRILAPYVRAGMSVLDLGCGSGFFAVEMARLVGASGRVIAADVQDGMLRQLEAKIRGTEFEGRIVLHRCREDRIGVAGPLDAALAFYVIHEVPDPAKTFAELGTILTAGGTLLVVEPKYVHVSKRDFSRTVETALSLGFELRDEPAVFFGRAAVLSNEAARRSADSATQARPGTGGAGPTDAR